MEEALEASELPDMTGYSHTERCLEYLDISWRFKNKWILGGGILHRPYRMAYAYYEHPINGGKGMERYTYSLSPFDYRIYLEHALSPVDRFLTDRTEFLLGGGLIISKPWADFEYYYENGSDVFYRGESYQNSRIFGFQLRASGHIYVVKMISFSAGLEINLYQDVNMPDTDHSGDLPPKLAVLEAHSLNYSTVRFKVGAHLYF